MPIRTARRLTGSQRTDTSNRQLGVALAFVAGATNAGGFLAVHQYTSHMTGIVSSIADNLALGLNGLVWAGLGSLLAFIAGATCSSMMVHYARRQGLHSEFALPLLLEATLLLAFGGLGARLASIEGLFVPLTVSLLTFIMGLQNALVTKLTKGEIRTTHVTGVVTDMGIELGRLLYWNRSRNTKLAPVRADQSRLRLLTALLTAFLLGGVVGAIGFKTFGYLSTAPLALILVALAVTPAVDDARRVYRRVRGPIDEATGTDTDDPKP